MKNLLNAYQWNSLRITLLSFEESLHRAQAWLDGEEQRGLLYERRLTIPPKQQREAQREIRKALGLIAELSHLFELPKATENSTSLIRADMSVAWANLLDNRARKLGRYGDVHPELASALDPRIHKLAEAAQALTVIFSEDGKVSGEEH